MRAFAANPRHISLLKHHGRRLHAARARRTSHWRWRGAGRALNSCREYLLMVAKCRLDADLIAKGGFGPCPGHTPGRVPQLRRIPRPFARRAARLAQLDPAQQPRRLSTPLPWHKQEASCARDFDRFPVPKESVGHLALRFADAGLSGRGRRASRRVDRRPGPDSGSLPPRHRLAPVRSAHFRGNRASPGPLGRSRP